MDSAVRAKLRIANKAESTIAFSAVRIAAREFIPSCEDIEYTNAT